MHIIPTLLFNCLYLYFLLFLSLLLLEKEEEGVQL